MEWIKRGLIFVPRGDLPWSQTHAQAPTAVLLDDRIRIYYSTRDNENHSRPTFIDVSRDNPAQILYRHCEPVMELGAPGAHDEDGVMPGCILVDGDRWLLYYTGWSCGRSVPYRVAVGLAVSTDGGITFSRAFEGPVVDRTRHEPHMTMSPYVLRPNKGQWQMWYGSGLRWIDIDGVFEPIYAIKYAESYDGFSWLQPNILCVPPQQSLEANTRPSVTFHLNGYEMWFCYRYSRNFRDGSGAYRIGYATSFDGKTWSRQPDPSGLQATKGSWDGTMVAYPNVLSVGERQLMFYNGDGFGRSGIGFATLEGDIR